MCCLPIKLLWYRILTYVTRWTLCVQCLRKAGRLACCAHYVGSQRSQLTLWGVFGGRYHSQEGSWVSPSQGGRGYSGFVPKCTHQTHLIKGLQYISRLALFVSGVLACLHAGMVGEDCFPHKTPIWFWLIVLNKRWHTHISSRHPMVVGWGEWGGWIWGKCIVYWGDECIIKSPCLHLVWCADGGVG